MPKSGERSKIKACLLVLGGILKQMKRGVSKELLIQLENHAKFLREELGRHKFLS